jgi:hypothetical protein
VQTISRIEKRMESRFSSEKLIYLVIFITASRRRQFWRAVGTLVEPLGVTLLLPSERISARLPCIYFSFPLSHFFTFW